MTRSHVMAVFALMCLSGGATASDSRSVGFQHSRSIYECQLLVVRLSRISGELDALRKVVRGTAEEWPPEAVMPADELIAGMRYTARVAQEAVALPDGTVVSVCLLGGKQELSLPIISVHQCPRNPRRRQGAATAVLADTQGVRPGRYAVTITVLIQGGEHSAEPLDVAAGGALEIRVCDSRESQLDRQLSTAESLDFLPEAVERYVRLIPACFPKAPQGKMRHALVLLASSYRLRSDYTRLIGANVALAHSDGVSLQSYCSSSLQSSLRKIEREEELQRAGAVAERLSHEFFGDDQLVVADVVGALLGAWRTARADAPEAPPRGKGSGTDFP